jgi:hypothetical protein
MGQFVHRLASVSLLSHGVESLRAMAGNGAEMSDAGAGDKRKAVLLKESETLVKRGRPLFTYMVLVLGPLRLRHSRSI